jgi:hypothetical protein
MISLKLKQSLCIGYDTDKLRDGLGAQTLRQIGIFCIAREFKIGYSHKSIVSIDSNPGDGITNNQEMLSAIRNAEIYFGLNKVSCSCVDHDRNYRFRNLPQSRIVLELLLIFLSIVAFFGRKKYLILLPDPKEFLRDRGELLEHYRHARSQKICKTVATANAKRSLKIAIHIHWAMFGSVNRKERFQDTYLTLDFFDSILKIMTKVLNESNIEFEIEIYTAIPSKNLSWSPTRNLSNETLGAWQKTGMSDPDGNINLLGFDFVDRYGGFGPVRSFHNLDMFQSWQNMSNADVLLINRSTFSYLAGLNCQNIVISPTFQHPPLKNWIVVPQTLKEESEINFKNLFSARVKQVILWKP